MALLQVPAITVCGTFSTVADGEKLTDDISVVMPQWVADITSHPSARRRSLLAGALACNPVRIRVSEAFGQSGMISCGRKDLAHGWRAGS